MQFRNLILKLVQLFNKIKGQSTKMQSSHNTQQSSNLVQSSPNNTQVVPASDAQIQSHSHPIETPSVSLKLPGLGFSLHLNKLVVLGIFGVVITGTFLLLTNGSEFCFFSICTSPVTDGGISPPFWAFAGGSATLVILTSIFGVPLMPAVAASFGIWFLMQMSLH
jgi:hypothetical protein